MPPSCAIIVPTRDRPEYLDVALGSLAPQAAEHGAELLVIDDGPDAATRMVAERHGATYVPHEGPRGINAARNTAIGATSAELLIYVDDDVEVRPAWLGALIDGAARLPASVGVLTGPIIPRIEDHRFRACGREDGPISAQDFGREDRDCPHAWGANMAVRRSALDAVGPFDARLSGGGDEEEWQQRWLASGGRIHYLAAAALDHRRAGDGARLRSLCRAARARGRDARSFDERRGDSPKLLAELRTLAGCALHGPRYRCAMGPVMTWHAAGRIERALKPLAQPAAAGVDDFLSGRSGILTGKRAQRAAAHDRVLDVLALPARRRLAARARTLPPRRRVLAVAIESPTGPSLLAAARAELLRSRHDVNLLSAPAGVAGKFQNLNGLLAGRDLASYDWIVVLDDDITLPRAFLDDFLCAAEAAGLQLAQPAHRRRSHAAWDVTRRRARSTVRITSFVEIGPLTAFSRVAAAELLPFPDLRMGWGLDARWAQIARERGWPVGIVDATPIEHLIRATASTYPRAAALAEAQAFLAGKPYVTRDDVRTLRTIR